MSEMLIGVLRMPPELFWSDDEMVRLQHDNIRREAADEIERLQDELELERQRRFDGNEQASREHRADVSTLVEALEDIGASWHGVNTELEKYMRNVARLALADYRKGGE